MDQARFYKDFEEVKPKYPTLTLESIDHPRFPLKVRGDIAIIDHEGTHWQTFTVAIFFSRRYPYGFAVLQELSSYIPRESDRHISKTGECCVCSPLESLEMEEAPITVLDYLERYAIPYLANQVHYDQFGYYVNGEYSHDAEGLWEAFEDLFETKDRGIIMSKLRYIKSKPGRNDTCPCGSGKKLKHCHPRKFNRIRDRFLLRKRT